MHGVFPHTTNLMKYICLQKCVSYREDVTGILPDSRLAGQGWPWEEVSRTESASASTPLGTVP